ncbi:MAG: ABC transporter permease [Tepidisphaeraceae bacterium]|jgi:ABC-2 type transport system permease protein
MSHHRFLLPAFSLCQRELVRFLRQRNRIIGALATPIVFWVLLGAGMGKSFQTSGPGGGSFMQYFFPGTAVMILLFTAIFSTISIIEDRREGFLQSVLVAPVSRLAVVGGKILGGTLLATAQGVIFLLLAPLIGVKLTLAGFTEAVLIMLVVSFALTGLGFCIAWRMSSTQGFHAIMNLFLMPMWFLSGAMFPAEGAHGVMQWIMGLNPLTYGVSGLRRSLYADLPRGNLPNFSYSLGISILFALIMFWLAGLSARQRVAADLQ